MLMIKVPRRKRALNDTNSQTNNSQIMTNLSSKRRRLPLPLPSSRPMPRTSRITPGFLLAILILLPVSVPPVHAAAASYPCITRDNVCQGAGETYRPLPGCETYAQCGSSNDILSFHTCMNGTIFDVWLKNCNWKSTSFCIVPSCSPTRSPTTSPTWSPTEWPTVTPTVSPTVEPTEAPTNTPTVNPTVSPTVGPTHAPTVSPTVEPTGAPTDVYDFFSSFETESMRMAIESTVLQSYTSGGIAFPSTRYTFLGLVKALREMALIGIPYKNERTFKFYVGNEDRNLAYGLVNLAAFLANVMTESINYDTCDEFNWDQDAGRYAISNSCGQNGRSYQDEVCTNINEVHMSCEVHSDMEVTSSSAIVGIGGRLPPPLTCRPKAHADDYAGYFDSQIGTTIKTIYPNTAGRTDVEGCCFWGRGALLTRGVCNIGKLNYYLGKRAFDERGEGRFPTIDFCGEWTSDIRIFVEKYHSSSPCNAK